MDIRPTHRAGRCLQLGVLTGAILGLNACAGFEPVVTGVERYRFLSPQEVTSGRVSMTCEQAFGPAFHADGPSAIILPKTGQNVQPCVAQTEQGLHYQYGGGSYGGGGFGGSVSFGSVTLNKHGSSFFNTTVPIGGGYAAPAPPSYGPLQQVLPSGSQFSPSRDYGY